MNEPRRIYLYSSSLESTVVLLDGKELGTAAEILSGELSVKVH